MLVLRRGLQFLVSGLCLLDGAPICIISLLMAFEVAAVEKDLLGVMQVVLEEALLVYSVCAVLVQFRIITHLLTLLFALVHFQYI